jgi:DNA invertase Pin-like site-specific DNA recombinase
VSTAPPASARRHCGLGRQLIQQLNVFAAISLTRKLMVTRLDRLARSTRDLLNTLHAISQAGGGFKSLADSWADTTTPRGRLLVTMLAGIAEFERELIRARTGEGRARAKAKGVRFGRPRLANGETQAEIARSYNVDPATIGRLDPAPFGVAGVHASAA